MKILIISCSHRAKQTSYKLGKQFEQKINAKRDVEVEIVELAEYDIHGCCTNALCVKTPEIRCTNKKDDFNKLYDKMIESDGILFLVPKYAPYPSKLIAIIERLTAISWWGYGQYNRTNEFILAGKSAAMMAFANSPGISVEMFLPLFSTYAEIGFDVIQFNEFPALYCNFVEVKHEDMMEVVAQAFHDKLN